MDARVKPGHDSGACGSCAASQSHLLVLAARLARVLDGIGVLKKSEGARDAGVLTNPRTSISHETEAVRKQKPQVRRLSNVPRAVFGRPAPNVPRRADFATHRCEVRLPPGR